MINLCKIKYIAQEQVSQISLLTNDVTILEQELFILDEEFREFLKHKELVMNNILLFYLMI